jgi:hypothetical protein
VLPSAVARKLLFRRLRTGESYELRHIVIVGRVQGFYVRVPHLTRRRTNRPARDLDARICCLRPARRRTAPKPISHTIYPPLSNISHYGYLEQSGP